MSIVGNGNERLVVGGGKGGRSDDEEKKNEWTAHEHCRIKRNACIIPIPFSSFGSISSCFIRFVSVGMLLQGLLSLAKKGRHGLAKM
jgi:hypothetical protein